MGPLFSEKDLHQVAPFKVTQTVEYIDLLTILRSKPLATVAMWPLLQQAQRKAKSKAAQHNMQYYPLMEIIRMNDNTLITNVSDN